MKLTGITIEGTQGAAIVRPAEVKIYKGRKGNRILEGWAASEAECIDVKIEDAGLLAQKIALKIGYENKDDIAALEILINTMKEGMK